MIGNKVLNKDVYKDNNQSIPEIEKFNKYFNIFKSSSSTWMERASEYYQVVVNDVDGTGTQFTTEQLKTIKELKIISSSVNIAIAIIEVLQAFMTASEPIPNVYPIGNSSKEYSYFWREVLLWAIRENKFGKDILESLIFDQIVTGRGVVYVRPASYYDYNDFNIVIEKVNFTQYFPDPRSKRRDHQDSEMIFLSIPVSKEKAKKVYGLTDEEINMATGWFESVASTSIHNPVINNSGVSSLTAFGEEQLYIQEIFEKEKATLFILQDGTKTFERPETYIGADGVLVDLVKDEVTKIYIRRNVKVGNFIKSSDLLPITMYPLIIYGHTHVGTPYEYGMISQIIDLLYAINKYISLVIQSAQTASTPGYIAPKGSISDHKQFRESTSQVGGIGEYEPDPTLDNNGKPEQRIPQALNNAFYSLFKEFIGLIEYVTGVLPLLQGNASGAPDTLGATNQVTSFGMQRPKMYSRRVDSANDTLGQVIIEMFQAYAPEKVVLNYVKNTSAMTEIVANINLSMQQNEQGQQVYQEDYLGEKASIIQDMATNQLKVIFGDFREGKYKTYFQSTGGLPNTRAQAIDFLNTLLGRMSNDQMSVAVTEALFKLADVAEADEILRNINSVNQLSQQLQQTQAQATELQKENEMLVKKLENQIFATKEAEIEAEVKVKKYQVDAAVKDLKDATKEEKKKESKTKSYS